MGFSGVRGHGELGFHFHHKPLSRREIRILAQLGLGVAPRFLQKVRARPEIWTNKLGLLPRHEAAEAAQVGARKRDAQRGKSQLICQNFGAGPKFL